MARPRRVQNTILTAALEGLEIQRDRIEEQIREVRSMLGQRGPGRPKQISGGDVGAAKPVRKRRALSAAARKRIAAAQRARWARFRKANPPQES